MSTESQQIVNRAWSFAHVLRDDGLSYMAYTEQITFLLFLKMAHELTEPPYNKPPIVPVEYGWQSLLDRDGDALLDHYRHILEALGRHGGMLAEVFRRARAEIQNPATLRRLIVELIGAVHWSSLNADVKGDIYEGLLAKSAEESPKGAGQYFTPRAVIQAIVKVMRPTPEETVIDPACGTGGFLLAAHDHVVSHFGRELDPEQKRHLRHGFVHGVDLVPNTARLCIMNLYLHGVDGEPCPVQSGVDSLAAHPGRHFSMVLTNPPFGKKSSITVVNEVGDEEREDQPYERADFWTTTKNKQLNFVQHCRSILTARGRCAMVVPDNVLFEGGAGETVRRRLLTQCDVHTLLRLPTGIWYSPGVKANVLFFDNRPAREQAWTERLWVYDLRTNMHFTLKQNPIGPDDLAEFVDCYHPANRHDRRETWREDHPAGRWRSYDYGDLLKRDKLNLDIFWLKDDSLAESENLPAPEVLAQEITDDLEAALEQFSQILQGLHQG
ncbi:MAG: SAM-dependent DNA methyltransferase [Fimbriimonadaceae bacterium]|nr:SAM-dependent DNA methyltransferase [Fimbriimonadaceae bacterium]